jgi:hypothetical protein
VSDLAYPTVAGFCFDAFDDGWQLGEDRNAACAVCGRRVWMRDPDGSPATASCASPLQHPPKQGGTRD